MKNIICSLAILCASTIMLSAPTVTATTNIDKANPCDAGYVDDAAACQPIGDIRQPSTATLYDAAASAIRLLLMAVGALAIVMIIISGIKIATSGGDAEKVKNAKNTLLWSVIGLTLALLANVIISVVVDIANQV